MLSMQLPFDIVDYIFRVSLLVSDRKTLIACSKDPLLFPFVERHISNHIIVQFGLRTTTDTDSDILTFCPDHLVKHVSKNPRILFYVRILQIQIDSGHPDEIQNDSFANTLLKFPVLECIMLTSSIFRGWRFLDPFRAALEDRLNLPTVNEVHLTGDRIPISLLDNSKNIKNLSLSGFSVEDPKPFLSLTLPELHSLRLLTRDVSPLLLSWLKPHIKKLRSFKCALTDWDHISELLGERSRTLNKLDINIGHLQPFIEFSPVLPNLEQLTIHTVIKGQTQNYYYSSQLPLVVEVANLFLSSLHHLAIDIDLPPHPDFSLLDFSPLADLGAVSRSIPQIDLYVHTDMSPPISRAEILSLLEINEDIARSIKEGVLVIHLEEPVPDFV